MKPLVVTRSVVINGHKTRIGLERDYWTALEDIAEECNQEVEQLLASVAGRPHNDLSGAIRLFILEYYRAELQARKSAKDLDEFITPKSRSTGIWEGFE